MRARRGQLALVLLACCAGESPDPKPTAEALASGLGAALAAAEKAATPRRCARLEGAGFAAPLTMTLASGAVVSGEGIRLTVPRPSDGAAVFAVVGDAREAWPRSVAAIEVLAAEWTRERVALVIALGGMETEASELTDMLAPLATKDRVVVAAPGDRESVEGLEAAASALRDRGLPVFTSREVRIVDFGGATMGIVPGVANRSALVAGGAGCLHSDEDAAALAEVLAASPAPRIWLSYVAPRQHGASGAASDVSLGVHAGAIGIAAAVAKAAPQLAFHAQIAPTDNAPMSGVVAGQATPTQIVAVGAIEDLPSAIESSRSPAAAVLVTVAAEKISWRRQLHPR